MVNGVCIYFISFSGESHFDLKRSVLRVVRIYALVAIQSALRAARAKLIGRR